VPKFEIRNRWTGDVQYSCDLSAEIAGKSYALQLGFAIRSAHSSGAVLSGAVLSGADLSGADLSGADLSGADLSGADLSGAVLSGADLSGADLSGADWLPRIDNIHQAVYAAASAPNALNMGNWHTCETTHCRAGWVVHLAGAAGRVLEGCMGTPAAAALIYQASDPKLERIPDFYCSNEAALADMKRLAEGKPA
jgi:pentapeptide repeat protein